MSAPRAWLIPATTAEVAAALLAQICGTPAGWAALAGGGALLALAARRGRLRPLASLLGEERASAAAMDLALVVPVFTYIMLMFVQFAILLQDAQIVRYAAFVAARSARVHLCAPLPAPTLIGSGLALMRGQPCDRDEGRADKAARYALIAASPADPLLRCEGGCSLPANMPAGLAALAAGTGMNDHLKAWQNEARYAFDTANVKVKADITLVGALLSLPGAGNNGEHPGHARVEFHHILLPMMGTVFGSGKRTDGKWYAIMTAEATVL